MSQSGQWRGAQIVGAVGVGGLSVVERTVHNEERDSGQHDLLETAQNTWAPVPALH